VATSGQVGRWRRKASLDVPAEQEVALHPLLLDSGTVQRGVLDGDRQMLGDRIDELDVGGVERSALLLSSSARPRRGRPGWILPSIVCVT
jgi:hypothetical protein